MGAFEIALEHCQEAIRNAPKPQQRALTIKDIITGGGSSVAGVSVTPDTAMRTSAVWACVRVLSTSMGALPLHVLMNKKGGGSEKAVNEQIYNILHRTPNPRQTSYTFRSVAMAHLCLHGNAYAEIEFDNTGKPSALWPIPPWCCEPLLTPAGELYYHVSLPNGIQKNLADYRVLHIQGLGTDGLKGLSPIRLHAETIGVSLAATNFGASFFGRGANVGGIVEHPNKLSDQGSKHLRESLNEKYGGLGNAHRLMLLEEGMKYTKVGIPPEEAQFIETLQFHIEDIARIFGVQLHKIGHLLRATNNNIEHQGIEFVTDTILPLAVNWEMEYDRRLMIYYPGRYTKHSLEGLLRGDTAARSAFYQALFNMASLCPDEIREKEDMNPIEDGTGKRYYVMANLIPTDKVDEYLKKPAGNTNPARSLSETVKKIEERDKENILKNYRKDPVNFEKWLEDYKRDFSEYVERQLAE